MTDRILGSTPIEQEQDLASPHWAVLDAFLERERLFVTSARIQWQHDTPGLYGASGRRENIEKLHAFAVERGYRIDGGEINYQREDPPSPDYVTRTELIEALQAAVRAHGKPWESSPQDGLLAIITSLQKT